MIDLEIETVFPAWLGILFKIYRHIGRSSPRHALGVLQHSHENNPISSNITKPNVKSRIHPTNDRPFLRSLHAPHFGGFAPVRSGAFESAPLPLPLGFV